MDMIQDKMVEEIVPHLKNVYEKLMDEQSKEMFLKRLQYNQTLDFNYMLDIMSLVPEFDSSTIKEIKKIYNHYKSVMRDNPNCKFIIYGAGSIGRFIFDIFGDLNWACFCDKDVNKQKDFYGGLPVISPEQLIQEHQHDFVVIGSRDYYDEIYRELTVMGFPTEQILCGGIPFQFECLTEKQYFEDTIVLPVHNEIFVDAGCYNCETSLLFKEWCEGKYEKIYAFEPDSFNYLKCKEVIEQENIQRIELVNAGLWSKTDVLHFSSHGSGTSSITVNGSENTSVVSLDEFLKGQRVTFIKMDIEGSELEALKGARNTITTYRPKLAVCIYHKREDIQVIPLYLQSLVPDYKFYIRHYSTTPSEMVLYAI